MDCLNDLMERIVRLHAGEPSGIETSLDFYIAHWGEEIPAEETTKKSMRSIYPVEDWASALVREHQDDITAVEVRDDRITIVLKKKLNMEFVARRRQYKKTRDKTKIELQGWGMDLAELRWWIRRFENGIWR